MKKEKTESEHLQEALKQLLMEGQASTQEQMCRALESAGYDVNQSKVSRMLKKINAVKAVNVQGQTVYALPREPAPPTLYAPLKSLIADIVANESLVVIFTSPGCASMVARILDHHPQSSEVLGTIAGDDTIFVAPKSVHNIHLLLAEIKALFDSAL
jgi:transcriptional regulator of arginine metabolism